MRRILKGVVVAAAVVASLSWSQTAQAQAYPSRPVTIIVPGAPGGGGDFTARLLGEGLSRSLGQQFVIENKSGANGSIAAQTVARAKPDGHTLLLAYSGAHIVNHVITPGLPWHPVTSFEPVALAIKAPHVVALNKEIPATNLREFVAYAKANPGKVNYGTGGRGSLLHIGTEQLAKLGGLTMTHVVYRGGGQAVNDLLSGQIHLLITTPPAIVGNVQSGAIRALALASRVRHPMFPDVPTAAEAGFSDFVLDAWFGLYAPKGTPQPVVSRLAAEIERIVATPEFRRRSEENGTYAFFMGPTELVAFTESELAYWSKLIRDLGVVAE